MAGKINLIVRLQNWMDSVPGQTFLNYAYSWGASIVILGALFKLTHIQGGNIMLFIGMGTEVVVFFLSAFDRPFDKTEVGKELPEELETEEEMAERLGLNEEPTPESDDLPLAGEEPAEASPQTHIHMADEQADLAEAEQNATAVAAAAQAAQGSTGSTGGAPAGLQGVAAGGGGTIIIGGGVAPGVAAATQDNTAAPATTTDTATSPDAAQAAAAAIAAATPAGEQPFENEAQRLAQIIRVANDELLHRAQAVLSPEMEAATQTYIEKLQALAETFAKVDEQSARLTKDSEEMENLNRTLTGINKVYELHLKSISLQVGTIDQINEQTHKLAQQIEDLNAVYGRMIEALTVNMRGGQTAAKD